MVHTIKKNAVGVETYWKLKNGSTIDIMTNEQKSDQMEGWDGDWVWYDEPPRRENFVACQRGLVDRNGRSWLTMTPLKEAWIYTELYLKADSSSEIDVFLVDTHDNVGYGLSQSAVDSFAELLTPDEIETRLRGKFRQLSGLVYKEFNPKIHVVKPFAIPAHYPRWRAIDPHPRTPHAVMWLTCDPQGNKYVYDELFHHCLIDELCRLIRAKSGTDRVVKTICDPIAFNQNPVDNTCWADEFAKNGLVVERAPKDLAQGIMAVKRVLAGTNDKPELYVFNTCERTIWEFGMYQWDEWRGPTKQDKTPKERPKDKDDHMMENLYRLILQNPRYRDMTQEYRPIQYPKPDVP